MTIEETKIKRCEINLNDVIYEGEARICISGEDYVYLSVGLYSDVLGFSITKNSNFLYHTEGIGEEDDDYIEFWHSKEEMVNGSKYRRYFNILIAQIKKLAKSNGELFE